MKEALQGLREAGFVVPRTTWNYLSHRRSFLGNRIYSVVITISQRVQLSSTCLLKWSERKHQPRTRCKITYASLSMTSTGRLLHGRHMWRHSESLHLKSRYFRQRAIPHYHGKDKQEVKVIWQKAPPHSPVRSHPRGSKFVPLNSWGRGSY